MEPILPPSTRLSRRPVVIIPPTKPVRVSRRGHFRIFIGITILVLGFAFGLFLARILSINAADDVPTASTGS